MRVSCRVGLLVELSEQVLPVFNVESVGNLSGEHFCPGIVWVTGVSAPWMYKEHRMAVVRGVVCASYDEPDYERHA